MANVVRIKRRLTGDAGAPSALKNAELAFNEVGNVLYYGKGDDNGNATSRIAIGGDGAFFIHRRLWFCGWRNEGRGGAVYDCRRRTAGSL